MFILFFCCAEVLVIVAVTLTTQSEDVPKTVVSVNVTVLESPATTTDVKPSVCVTAITSPSLQPPEPSSKTVIT